MKKEIKEFLQQSNYIENERGDIALEDAKKAWKYAIKNKDQFSLDYILKIHKILMERLNPRIAGKLRTCSIRIGYDVKIYEGEDKLKKQLKNWLNYFYHHNGEDKLKNQEKSNIAKSLHVDFEDIHPFEDGNGRVGRILWQIHRINLGLPIEIIHEGNEQHQYYKWFKKDIIN